MSMKDSNEQIVTPKATQHVVDGDFIDAEPVNKSAEKSAEKSAGQASKATSKNNKKAETATTRSASSSSMLLFWLSAIIFAGGAAYMAFQALEKTNNLVTDAELNHAYEQQQMQLEIMANQLQQLAAQSQKPSFDDASVKQLTGEVDNLQAQLNEQTLVITQLQNELNQARQQLETAEPKIQSTESSTGQNQPSGQISSELAQSLEELDKKLLGLLEAQGSKEQEIAELTAKFFEFSRDTNEKLKNYLQSGEWESDKAELGEKMGQIESQLGEIAALVSPKMEAVVEEVGPQLDGILSIFNQFFQVKKHSLPEESEGTK